MRPGRFTPRAPWPWPTPAPGTNGSQFFLVYGDTPLAPNYSVFGTYNGPGQATIDKIAAGGIAPSPDIPGGEDGAPKTPVTIQQAATEG